MNWSPSEKSPLQKHDEEVERQARLAAGLLEYAMDDPERPMTSEYDPPAEELPDDTPEGLTGAESDSVQIEDTTPSADARELYAVPSSAELRETRKRHIREEYIEPARRKINEAEEAETLKFKQKRPYSR